jgi:hypothetical protein
MVGGTTIRRPTLFPQTSSNWQMKSNRSLLQIASSSELTDSEAQRRKRHSWCEVKRVRPGMAPISDRLLLADEKQPILAAYGIVIWTDRIEAGAGGV